METYAKVHFEGNTRMCSRHPPQLNGSFSISLRYPIKLKAKTAHRKTRRNYGYKMAGFTTKKHTDKEAYEPVESEAGGQKTAINWCEYGKGHLLYHSIHP